MGLPKPETAPPYRRIIRRQLRHGSGLGQLSLVEHALCPLDPKASRKCNLVFDADYFFMDKHRHQKKAHATVLCPLGLAASDELFLWGLLALTFSQSETESELHATPHYCLRQLGVIDKKSRRGGRQYDCFRETIERLSTVTYRNDHFYDPIRSEHRRVAFGFLSYSLPLDPESSRAWRIAWDPIFFEFVAAAGGHFRFDLATYRKLDAASRRLFLFVSKVFARRETTPRLKVRHLAEHVLGFSPTLKTKYMKVKVARTVSRLVETGVVAPCADLFQKYAKGDYSLVLTKGPYYARRTGSAPPETGRESALFDPLFAIGFDGPTAEHLLCQHPAPLLREWADITLAAKERFGAGFFKRSPQAYFVDNVNHAAAGTRTPPDWWHEVRKAEQKAVTKIPLALLGDQDGQDAATNGQEVADQSQQLLEKVRDDFLGHLLAAGESKANAAAKADRIARDHVRRKSAAPKPGPSKIRSLLRRQTS